MKYIKFCLLQVLVFLIRDESLINHEINIETAEVLKLISSKG